MDAQAIVVGNERSANEGNGIIYQGVEVNHQVGSFMYRWVGSDLGLIHLSPLSSSYHCDTCLLLCVPSMTNHGLSKVKHVHISSPTYIQLYITSLLYNMWGNYLLLSIWFNNAMIDIYQLLLVVMR